MQSTGSLLQMNYGHLVGKETKMVITGIIILGITVYAVWAAVVRDVLEKSIAISNLDGSRWL